MEKGPVKAQSPVSPVANTTKKAVVKGLGFIIFAIGAFIIISAYLGTPLVGQVIKDRPFASVAAILGLFLEVIGITLMVIRVTPKCEEPKLV